MRCGSLFISLLITISSLFPVVTAGSEQNFVMEYENNYNPVNDDGESPLNDDPFAIPPDHIQGAIKNIIQEEYMNKSIL